MIFSVGIMIDSRGDTDRKKRQIAGEIQIERKDRQEGEYRQKENMNRWMDTDRKRIEIGSKCIKRNRLMYREREKEWYNSWIDSWKNA